MAQTWSSNPFDASHNWDDDMAALENNLLALQSGFSGSGAPSSPVAGQLWMRTGGTGNGLRVRNADNDDWLKVLEGDASQKMWVYRNDTCEGWTIDSSVTDRVLAIKGGTRAYNVAGGNTAGAYPTASVSRDGWGNNGSVAGTSGRLVVGITGSNMVGANSAAYNKTILDGTERPAAAVGTLQYPDLA